MVNIAGQDKNINTIFRKLATEISKAYIVNFVQKICIQRLRRRKFPFSQVCLAFGVSVLDVVYVFLPFLQNRSKFVRIGEIVQSRSKLVKIGEIGQNGYE